ncbi:MAG: CRISPR-associated endonuclease Cas3'' [Zoogloeaceae bacterium]|nr:CRISPR-associated endonuclease Cas3'' [Rhodocyclaceae bacterium]MCP5234308.1 CRISPR-associated endonuclease Cas3'' [Zoogloeaceae bacterium]
MTEPTDQFFAHSGKAVDRTDWQPLALHLHNVGRMAADRAAYFGCSACGEAMGLLHDVGKYTAEFQLRISGDAVRVDHATRGAMLAVERYGMQGYLLAYGIAGHHAGLANGAEALERTAMRDRLRDVGLPALLDQWKLEIELPQKPALSMPFKPHSQERGNFQLAFLARMLFSCLVDADFLDTEAYYKGVEGKEPLRNAPLPTLGELRDHLDAHLARFSADSEVNRIRAEILRHVRLQAEHDPGLFSLTVPTGGGKTLASLAFALDHAIRHGLRRVIFVIPFTSIVEQNAAVFRSALSPLGERAVLEHHSAFVAHPPQDEPEHYQAREKLRLAMENWDAPIIVTTAVQFFESLFAARPSQCRKLHNIAGSVVILDEAQTLPLKLLRPAVAAIDELARNYHSSIVLCTATQPALQAPAFEGGLAQDKVRELAPEPPGLFRKLERVRIRHVGILDDAGLTAELLQREQVLCVVNNRRHARAAYQAIADLPGARHLSTLMCAKHRSAALAEIRAMLKRGQPCRLVSTSLIEAGVDISLPTVLRAEAGLDSIAQAAGRCNRNMEWPVEASEVLVFGTANPDWTPPPELRQFAQAAHEILRQAQYRTDPLSPASIQAYFQLLYWHKGQEALDGHNLLGLVQNSSVDSLPLETLATKFRMIESVQTPVIVPYDEEAHDALEALRHADRCGGLARKLQPYLVQLPRQSYHALCQVGAVQPVALEKWGEQFMVLRNMDLYTSAVGLNSDDPTFVRAESLIL